MKILDEDIPESQRQLLRSWRIRIRIPLTSAGLAVCDLPSKDLIVRWGATMSPPKG